MSKKLRLKYLIVLLNAAMSLPQNLEVNLLKENILNRR